MRRVRYGVAMSLDGYTAGPNGEYDWIVMDPEIDFGRLMAEFDTFLVGRRSFEAMAGQPDGGQMPGIDHGSKRGLTPTSKLGSDPFREAGQRTIE